MEREDQLLPSVLWYILSEPRLFEHLDIFLSSGASRAKPFDQYIPGMTVVVNPLKLAEF